VFADRDALSDAPSWDPEPRSPAANVEDFFSALCTLRSASNHFDCGVTARAFPCIQAMSRTMGCGERAYRLTMGHTCKDGGSCVHLR
jgi:hypothetical protein